MTGCRRRAVTTVGRRLQRQLTVVVGVDGTNVGCAETKQLVYSERRRLLLRVPLPRVMTMMMVVVFEVPRLRVSGRVGRLGASCAAAGARRHVAGTTRGVAGRRVRVRSTVGATSVTDAVLTLQRVAVTTGAEAQWRRVLVQTTIVVEYD